MDILSRTAELPGPARAVERTGNWAGESRRHPAHMSATLFRPAQKLESNTQTPTQYLSQQLQHNNHGDTKQGKRLPPSATLFSSF